MRIENDGLIDGRTNEFSLMLKPGECHLIALYCLKGQLGSKSLICRLGRSLSPILEWPHVIPIF